MTHIEVLREIEEFLDGAAARGETLNDARLTISSLIVANELRGSAGDETAMALGMKFFQEALKQ